MKNKINSSILISWLVITFCACTQDVELKSFPKLELSVPVEYSSLEKQNISCSIILTDTQECVVADNRVKIKLHGNSTAEFPKKPFRIKLNEKKSLCGLPEAKKWILLANYFDKTMLRNAVAFKMSEDSRLAWTPHYCFLELYYNGSHKGTYQLTEKVEVAPNRVTTSEDGWLIEIDARVTEQDEYFRTPHMENPYRIDWPDETLTYHKKAQIQMFLEEAETTLFGNLFTDSVKGWRKYLDEDSWIDWFIINEIAKNGDGNFYSSCYMHLDTCGKIAMGPIWDYDTCFGNNIFEDPRNPEGFYVRNSEWYSRLMEDDLFAQHVHERFAFFYNNKDEYYNFLRLQAQSLHPAIKSNDEIWHTIGEQISPYLIPCETYEEDLNLLIVWLEKRLEWLKNNL